MSIFKPLRLLLYVATCAALLVGVDACSPHSGTDPASLATSATHAASVSDTAAASATSSAPMRVQRVVMLIRHGVRPPTRPVVVPAGYAQVPWPAWDVPPGHLTAHGYKGAVLVGAWERATFAADDLFPTTGCPAPGSVVVWADTDQRTVKTGEAFAQGFAPDCGIQIGHADGDRNDPLFAPVANQAVPYDPLKAKAAVMARVGGDLDSAMQPLKAAFRRLGAVMGCCSRPLCKASGLPAGCSLAALPHIWEKLRAHEHVDLMGPLAYGGTAAQTILLEYVNGKPMKDVGWGRASAADIELISKIHAAEFDFLGRTPYLSKRASTPIMQRVLDVFAHDGAPRLTVLVGHDTNVASVGGMLDVHWQVPGYAKDDQAVNGALGVELLRDAKGRRFVRVFFQAQSTQQLRELQVLDDNHKPYFAYLPQPLCGLQRDRTLCTVADFRKTVSARMVH